MKIIFICFLISLLFDSCTSTLNIMDFSYAGEYNIENIYIVDTIEIRQPITIHYGNSKFVTSKNLLYQQKYLTKNFFLRPDVYLLRSDISRDYSKNDLKNYPLSKTSNCELEDAVKFNGYYTREFKSDSIQFILGLINVNFYNVHFNSENYYQIRQKNQKINYYRIVYPLCK